MPIDPVQVQRLNSLVASLEPRFDEIAREFFDRFERACPVSKTLRPATSRRARAEFAACVTMVLKNLSKLDAASAAFTYASERCQDVGIMPSDMPTARACLLSAIRQAAGATWTSEHEVDMTVAIAECFSRIHTSHAKQRRAAA